MSNPDSQWRGRRRRPRGPALILAVLAVIVAAAVVYNLLNPGLPSPGSDRYQQMVSAFYTGAVALTAGDVQDAPKWLVPATKIVPQEPASWADLGLYEMIRESPDLSLAQQYLDRARALAPKNADIEALLGSLEETQGDYARAIAFLTQAVALDPSDVQARYRLVSVIEQQSPTGSDPQQEQQLQAILAAQPGNLVAQLDLAHLAASDGQVDLLRSLLAQLASQSSSWPADSRDQLKTVESSYAANPRAAAIGVLELRNLLQQTAAFQQALAIVGDPEGSKGTPITHFILLPSPAPAPAAPDTALAYAPEPIVAPGKWSLVRSAWLTQDGPPALVLAGNGKVQVQPPTGAAALLSFPGSGPGPNDVLPIDWNDDKLVDLALAGDRGMRLYQQNEAGGFSDVTASAKIPEAITAASYTGAWAANLETGGDLDIVLGVKSGAPIVLRNNGDGTFTPTHPFLGAASGLAGFAWVDLNGDGLADAALVDGGGRLSLYQNEGSGQFQRWNLPTGLTKVAAVAAADLFGSGSFSIILVTTSGAIESLALRNGALQGQDTAGDWVLSPLAQAGMVPSDGSAQLYVADLDNNGALDLILSSSAGTEAWLGDGHGRLLPLAARPDVRDAGLENDGTSGHLNLVGLSSSGAPVRLVAHAAKSYHWQQIRLAAQKLADHRNNSYGIGGQIAVRAGLLYEEQIVTAPVTHFGLGTYARANAARIIWPNGVPQAEFALAPDSLFGASERLKGSCPWLFAWNGHDMAFVTDFLWRSALGLRIDGEDTAGVPMTTDWNKIGGDQLVPMDGTYDLRLDTQLWETYYFDTINLMVVDHPADTQMWVDERFSIPPPRLACHIMGPAQPVVSAVDDHGRDVTDLVRARDGRYVDTFALSDYQGLAQPHYIQLDLGTAPAGGGRQWLLANGWIHPTDSSINLALSFGHHPHPTGLSLWVPAGKGGGWRDAQPSIGFPEGKNKTILIDLTGLFKPGQERVVRLATNMEIYWDWIATAVERPGEPSRTKLLVPAVADLRYHGFNVTRQAKYSSPETPDYDHLAAVGQQWRDMTGYFTRYGDVRPLLARIDDRYVIMNAGDEIALRFAAPPPPPPGWTRDFVLIGDGWGKDCDINTGFGRTVLPLPSHSDSRYTRPPVPLEDDPVFRAHRADWRTYQTRYVSDSEFDRAFLPTR